MIQGRLIRGLMLVATGALVFQTGSCTTTDFLLVLQTALLGVTAAGAVVIIRNIQLLSTVWINRSTANINRWGEGLLG